MAGCLAISYLAAYLNGWLVGYLAGYLNGSLSGYLDGWLAVKKIKDKNNKELGNKNSYYFFPFYRAISFLFAGLARYLAIWIGGWLSGWLIGWWLVRWLADWVVACSLGGCLDGLAD